MRLFERCFLVKMQGKAPKQSMDGISDLLSDTHNEISALVNKYKTIKSYIDRFEFNYAKTVFQSIFLS